MKLYFISDLHIKEENKTKGILFLKFLSELPQDTTHLILLGDVFDLWVADHQYFIKKFSKIIEALKALKNRGVEIHYFEGNHDFHLKKYWQDVLGFHVHENFHFFRFEGLTIRAEHGDLMNPDDRGYLFLRWFWRTSPLKLIAHSLPGSSVSWIGERSSQMSRVYTDKLNQKYKEKVTALTREYAQKIYQQEPFDLFISGHTHVEDDFTFERNGKTVRSINLGTWLTTPKAFVVTTNNSAFITLS